MSDFMTVKKSKLVGEVCVSGAKNSVLKLLTASLLTEEKIHLKNYPSTLGDAQIHVGMLEALGKKCVLCADEITITEINPPPQHLEWGKRSIRNTLLILGALVSRNGEGQVPLPGGCQIGERKYDLHEMVLRKMGADVWVEQGKLCASVETRLKGCDIHLPMRSTGATENTIICGTLAHGITRLWNPHIRPEVLDLINFLVSMGAKIKVFGQEHIEITGVESLRCSEYQVASDNMEAITWLIASVISGGDVEIFNFPYRDLEVPLIHLRESGARFFNGENSLIVRGGCCYPVEISTGPYPGINSDMQPLFAVYGACAKGESRIIDLRFPGRYAYAEELKKMGVCFGVDGNLLKVHGNGGILEGANVKAIDLRAGIALALAGFVAENETVIEDAWQIKRGYDNFIQKACALGAHITNGHTL